MYEKATIEEMKTEAIARLEILQVPEDIIAQYPKAFDALPVTLFSAEVGEMEAIHRKALDVFHEMLPEALPYYMTESWHGWDVISILYVSEFKAGWELERESIEVGYLPVFSYNVRSGDIEIAYGGFSIEHDVLWRVC